MKNLWPKQSAKWLALTGVVLFSSCGRYYSAEIAGYIRDSESKTGINSAVVYIFSDEPAAADSDGYVVRTTSLISGGNGGYYNFKIIWRNFFPAFGEEGDSGTVWIGVVHDDYADEIARMQGILSDTVNTVPDILLQRDSFSVPQLTGTIVDVNGEGINNVRVVLDLASTDADPDYITTTAFIGGADGTYQFNDVTWRDDEPDSASSDTEDAVIYVGDATYETDASGIVAIVLTSDQEVDVDTPIVATRIDTTEFSVAVTGRCLNRFIGADSVQLIPVQGVGVTLTYKYSEGGAAATLHTLYDQTDGNGAFTFLIQWEDLNPGNFDGETDVTAADDSIPSGEDGLYIQIQYDDSLSDGITVLPGDFDIDGGDPAVFDVNDFALKSWINPNYVPDAVLDI